MADEATIYLIRHAEKPFTDSKNVNYNGVDDTGSADPESVIPRGWRRAGAWAVFFGSSGGLPSPARIYAADDEKEKLARDDKVGSHSQRPLETVSELALTVLGAVPDTSFTKGEEQALVDQIIPFAGVTLVCWQHEAIPDIALLLIPGGPIPSPWPGDRFDVVWRFRRAAGATQWAFDQVCPKLLSGDSAEPIAS